jgi:hypothetical protein
MPISFKLYKKFFFLALFFAQNLHSQTLTSSNLPIFILQTNGQTIVDEPKITISLKVISNPNGQINNITDTPTAYNGKIGIEVRGASSQGYPQQPYAFETLDDAGQNMDVSLLGLPEESDWVLLSHFNDKSLMRNQLAFNLFRDLGHWSSHLQPVELILNGQYQGIYGFGEKIKRDANRIDIAKLKPTDLAGDSLTGGYIFKVDYYDGSNSWLSDFHPLGHPNYDVHFVFYYPKPGEIAPEQSSYLRNYVKAFETALYGTNFKDTTLGYAAYIDVNSFIDYWIISEVSRNNDGYKKSCYFYKDKESKGGKIHAGPVWDFDWAWKNIEECPQYAATNGSGWSYRINDCNPDVNSPGWITRLLQDTAFANRARCRYLSLRENVLATDNIHAFIDSNAMALNSAQQRHFAKWPQSLSEQGPTPETWPYATTYSGEITKIKDWIAQRLTWLDTNWPGLCSGETPIAEPEPNIADPFFAPNPTNDEAVLKGWKGNMPAYSLVNSLGQEVAFGKFNGIKASIDVSNLTSGVYFCRILGWDNKQIGVAVRLVKF